MSKLKQNLFVLALSGLGVAFLALGYFFIVQPLYGKTGLGASKKKLADSARKLDAFLREEVLPTEDYRDAVENAKEDDEKAFEEAQDAFKKRCARFLRYFDESERRPEFAQFSAKYKDAVGQLRQDYWREFPQSRVTEGENAPAAGGDESKIHPTVGMIDDQDLSGESDTAIPRAMKQYWIAEAVFKACHELKIAGLKSIEFQKAEQPGRRAAARPEGARGRAAEERRPPYQIQKDEIVAIVSLHMPYSKLEDFLAFLLDRSQRVPFLDPPKVTVQKIDDEEAKKFLKIIREEKYPNEQAARAAAAAGEPKVGEPPVSVTLHLAALDFQGVKIETPAEERTKD